LGAATSQPTLGPVPPSLTPVIVETPFDPRLVEHFQTNISPMIQSLKSEAAWTAAEVVLLAWSNLTCPLESRAKSASQALQILKNDIHQSTTSPISLNDILSALSIQMNQWSQPKLNTFWETLADIVDQSLSFPSRVSRMMRMLVW
jgi:hypothetical protein